MIVYVEQQHNPIQPGLLDDGCVRGEGGGGDGAGGIMSAACNSCKNCDDIEVNFGGVVKNHKLYNLM